MKYKIVEMRVYGYKRLALSESKELNIKPKDIHLILGTNGSGKSSIMSLLTPLPPNRKDFTEDGFKEIFIRFNNCLYRIYSRGSHHTIDRDNTTILDSAGLKMCTAKVGEIFGININDYKFMLGMSNMVDMNLQQRKDFISSISSIDFDYANGLYNSMKKNLRDTQGVLRHINNKVLGLKEYVVSDTEMIDSLVKKEKDIKALIFELYDSKRNPKSKSINKIEKAWLSRVSKKLESIKSDITAIGLSDIKSLEEEHIKVSSKLAPIEIENNQIEETLLEMSRSISSVEAKELIKDINNTIHKMMETRVVDSDNISHFNIHNRNALEQSLESLYEDIFNLESKPMNEIEKEMTKLLADKDNLERQLSTSNRSGDILRTKIEMYQSITDDIKCPKCHTTINTDTTKDEVSTLTSSLDIINNESAILVRRIEEVESDMLELSSLKKDITSVLDKCSALGIYRFIPSEEVLSSASKIFNILNDVKSLPMLEKMRKEKEDIIANTIDDSDAYDSLVTKHNKLTSVISDLKSSLSDYSKTMAKSKSLSDDLDSIRKYLLEVNEVRKTDINKSYDKSIDEMISYLKQSSNETSSRIDHLRHSSREYTKLTAELESVERDAKIYKVLIEQLNPSTGLIAMSVKSFLLNYIDDVNSIISSVWSYDLTVLPYDSNELEKGITYRFPIKANGDDNASDISDTSESMREIISLAFRIVSLKYMNLLGCPLMIDEFGRSMDEVHLIKSYDLLESLSNEYDIQMFIIAHIKSCYNRFKSSGMTIISDLNLENMD